MQCIKRQKIVNRSLNVVTFRCINAKCSSHGQEVTTASCSACPSLIERHKRMCGRAPNGPSVHAFPAHCANPKRDKIEKQVNDEVEKYIKAEGIEMPSISIQLWNYKEALIKWIKAGRPTRTQEEVDHVLNTYCNPATPCDWYDKDSQRCRGCGCKVTTSSFAVANKLKMKTERCPQGKF